MELGETSGTQREALTGRLPVRGGERIYKGFFSTMWTWTSFEAATWCFLVGSMIPYLGNTWVGTIGFVAGMGLGMVVVNLAVGHPSTRFGVDVVEVSKSSWGTRGSVVPLAALVFSMVGWSVTLASLTSRMLGGIVQNVQGASAPNETAIVGMGIVLVVVVWILTVFGPQLFLKMSNFVAPGILVISVAMWVLLIARFGTHPFTTNIDPQFAMSPRRWTQILLSLEFGFANAWTFWPMMGAIDKLVKRQTLVQGPSIVGMGLLAVFIIQGVAAFAAVQFGTADPVVWMSQIGGRTVGIVILTLIVLHNIAPMIVMIYISGLGAQQVKALTRVKWPYIVAGLLVPALVATFYTKFITEHILQILSYGGVLFAAMVGISLVDHWVLRNQELDLRSVFCRTGASRYYFWGGVNWIALVVFGGATALDLLLLDPVTYVPGPGFNFIGSSIPTIAAAAVAYYLLTRLVSVPLGVGGYDKYGARAVRRSSTQPVPDAEVSL